MTVRKNTWVIAVPNHLFERVTKGQTLRHREVWTLDIADIQHPRLKRHYSLTGNPGTCGFWRDRVVIPAGYQGLLVERRAHN